MHRHLLMKVSIFTLFFSCSVNILASDKSSKMTNNSIGQSPAFNKVEDPVQYYVNRLKAHELVRQEDWQAAQPILESLTNQFADDGDTWYILGLTYLQLQEWGKAIVALKKTVDLGTILSNIPVGSPPSNDIMINIAEAYAELGQAENAIAWIKKSLAFRYDDRKNLIDNIHFKKIARTKAFQEVSGSFLPNDLSRVESWQFDLQFLVSEIKRLHVNMYHTISENNFETMVAIIHKKIPTLSDQQIVFEFMKLLASTGNGHNFIVPAYAKRGSFSQLPLQFYLFSDGLFIVAADEEYRHLVGSKVVSIGNTAVEEALERTKKVNARDNEMQHLWLAPHYLGLAEVLEGLNIVDSAKDISITIENTKGEQHIILPKLRAMNFNGFPKLPALANSDEVHNLRVKKTYWYQHIPEQSAFYVQYNYVHNAGLQSFESFNLELRHEISLLKPDNIILDIRHNAGGDGSTYPPILKTLMQFESIKPDGKLFVVIGRNTFSAAHNLLLDINRLNRPILVGEPSGSRPNALSEAGWVKLPYSGTWGVVSSQFHQASKAEDHRIWVSPHVPVGLSSKDYFLGNDPAMDAIKKIIKHSES